MTPDDPAQLAQLRHDWVKESLSTDALAEMLERRISVLEEITATRAPRRWLLRSRLGRQLRRSVRHVQGGTFRDRLNEAAGLEWLSRQ